MSSLSLDIKTPKIAPPPRAGKKYLLRERTRKTAQLRNLAAVWFTLYVGPALCGELQPVDAQRLVVGRWWSFNCSEGTKGFGMLLEDGAVHITIQEPDRSPVKHDLQAGTVIMTARANCAFAQVGPVTLRPCFSVDRISSQSFRGRVSSPFWMWALWGRRYCDFVSFSPHLT
jgi:hypothetical protein